MIDIEFQKVFLSSISEVVIHVGFRISVELHVLISQRRVIRTNNRVFDCTAVIVFYKHIKLKEYQRSNHIYIKLHGVVVNFDLLWDLYLAFLLLYNRVAKLAYCLNHLLLPELLMCTAYSALR